MLFDWLGTSILVALIALFGWLARRAWRSPRRWLRWTGAPLAGVLSLVLLAAFGVAFNGFRLLNATHANPIADVRAAATPDRIARGERLAQMCAMCHGVNNQLPLAGQDFFADGPPIGKIYAANLTPAHLKDWSDGEIIRAFREGVHKNGRSLVIMPARWFYGMGDADAQALVAYLRAQPAVEPSTPPTSLNVLGAFLVGMPGSEGAFSAQPPLTSPVSAPAAGVTPAYGEYLSTIGMCRECHGDQLQGRVDHDGPPPGPSLRIFAQQHSEAEFITLIRKGIKPDGQPLAEGMPWKNVSAFSSDDDLRAIYAYMRSLPATP